MITYISNGSITSVSGIKADGVFCGLKKYKKDLAIIISDYPSNAGGTFTLNKVQAAPLLVSKSILEKDQPVRAILINSGNANACTGEKGFNNALEVQKYCAEKYGLDPNEVLISSTGVIGVQLNTEKVMNGIDNLQPSYEIGSSNAAAEAILTTDTYAKSLACKVQLSEGEVTIGGICKGSGMIMPNMATMLAFIATDAAMPKSLVQIAISEAVNKSFNRISVDGDTSTNDMVVLMANGASGISINGGSKDYKLFEFALNDLCKKMAQEIIKDGEGATKFVSVIVNSAKSESDADIAAKAIVNSPLVKTAINGADANWGRILSAVGNSGINFSPEKVSIKIGEYALLKRGYDAAFDESIAKQILLNKEIEITVDLNEGDSSTNWWTCDFSQEYIKINANYRS
ncbi:MAG: bifunctional glutamate N-acetyltransferase/amino-acid acetyltransferase ArgJ [Bacteroidetes bacterium]|nr:bifunctional glutamate N-acetyltransferase/amino-acid acetyltransferase ArgJ [Bacteroidota bacterium]MBU2508262.1 bifunctional glutamate N-acetyltransferase/amino-acid acetyltransferase ArgJ [Bacteroidota bacterium]